MSDCVFCKLASGEFNRATAYEDDNVVAIIPLGYVSKGHVLIIPKKHSETVLDADDEDMKAIAVAIKKVSKAVMKATKCDGINVNQNNFKAAGQEVPHLHFHIIPRFSDDGLKLWKLNQEYEDGEMDKLAADISKNL